MSTQHSCIKSASASSVSASDETVASSGRVSNCCLAISIGHAIVAKRLGYEPAAIVLRDIHGYCFIEYIKNDSFERDEAIIAWGGVIAQLVVALPLILIASTTNILNDRLMAPVVGVLGYYNILLVVINLLPLKTLDGSKAWRLFSILYFERRDKKAVASKSKSERNIKRIK